MSLKAPQVQNVHGSIGNKFDKKIDPVGPIPFTNIRQVSMYDSIRLMCLLNSNDCDSYGAVGGEVSMRSEAHLMVPLSV